MTGKTILVVDDEAHILHVLSLKLLQNAGYVVVTANDGEEAFEGASTGAPDRPGDHGFPDAGDVGPGAGAGSCTASRGSGTCR